MRKPRNIGSGLKPAPYAEDEPAKPASKPEWQNRTLIIHRMHLGDTLEYVYTLTRSPSRDRWYISRVEDSGTPGNPNILSVNMAESLEVAEARWQVIKDMHSKERYVWQEFAGTVAKVINEYPITPDANDDYLPAQLGDV